jgi:hypothetical protein
VIPSTTVVAEAMAAPAMTVTPDRFRKLGFIEYNGRIRVYKSLLNVVLHDQLPEHNSERPPVSASLSS